MNLEVSRLQHDDLVRDLAVQYLAAGYQVHARVEGWFEQPDYILGYRPDIVARKGDSFMIVEVKKGDVDWPKILAFQTYERRHSNYTVRIVVPDSKSK